jgi:hypothetical protein
MSRGLASKGAPSSRSGSEASGFGVAWGACARTGGWASEPWDVLTFSGLLAALGSASEAAMVWRDLRGLEAAKPRPRSWFVLP